MLAVLSLTLATLIADRSCLVTLVIRQAGIADAGADSGLVSDLIQRLIAELDPDGAIDGAVYDAVTAQCLALPTVDALLAFDDGDAVGVLMLNTCAAVYAGGVFGEISELYVMPERRSRGVAALLLEAGAALGRSRGWQRLEVGAPIQPAWSKTLAFYVREGFEETGPRLRKLL
jgi:GNAT superfamily N-acetyltransferase